MSKKQIPKHLYTAKELKEVRKQLFDEQEGKCLLTHAEIQFEKSVLDHDHKTDYVRGVLHRNVNSALGRIENLYTRELSWWYTGTLSSFLKECAEYLNKKQDTRFIHSGFLKTLKIMFNKLSEGQKDAVLVSLGSDKGKNGVERKKLFNDVLLSRKHTKSEVVNVIKEVLN